MNCSSHEDNPNAAQAVATSGDLARELRTLWHGIVRATERSAHLDQQQYWVLSALERGPQRMTALAEAAQTSQTSLTGIVDRLEEQNLVGRERSSEDRRVVDVSLRDGGREQLARTRAAFAEQFETTFAPLSAEERAAFLGVLRKLNAAQGHTPRG